jgi:hypothetical protein
LVGFSQQQQQQHLRFALQAETEACVAAVEGAVALGLHHVVFQTE